MPKLCINSFGGCLSVMQLEEWKLQRQAYFELQRRIPLLHDVCFLNQPRVVVDLRRALHNQNK